MTSKKFVGPFKIVDFLQYIGTEQLVYFVRPVKVECLLSLLHDCTFNVSST